MKTAYAYARFSSDNQREESIDAQVRAIKEYCQQNDIVLLRVFKDEAYSARTAKRPEKTIIVNSEDNLDNYFLKQKYAALRLLQKQIKINGCLLFLL